MYAGNERNELNAGMVRIFLILMMWVAGIALWGQEVLPAAGDVFYSGSGSISFTLGEAVTETLSDGTYTMTQGFGQGDPAKEIGIWEQPSQIVRILPDGGSFVSDYFILRMQPAPAQPISYHLIGVFGTTYANGVIAGEETKVRMAGMASGVYVVVIGERTWKVVKL